MMPALALFQDRFARALFEHDAAHADGALRDATTQPGFAVYRNTVMKACIDALQANYPAVDRLVGGEWMRAAAAVYARAHPPRVPMLFEYGEGFDAFLAGFEPAASLPYLPGVAKLDRCWIEAHLARDEEPLAPADFAQLDPQALGDCRLRPHASARWAYFAEAPVATIWRCNRYENEMPADLPWRGEGLLLVRPDAAVEAVDLDAADCAFMSACLKGASVAEAAASALEADGEVDFAALMSRLLGAGAFARGDGRNREGES